MSKLESIEKMQGYMPCSGSCGERECPELCLCTETQHKAELEKRDGKYGPMQAPMFQQMSRFDQAVPPVVGYSAAGYASQSAAFGQPAVAYGQPYPAPQSYGQLYQQTYAPQAYPSQGAYSGSFYPPSGHPK